MLSLKEREEELKCNWFYLYFNCFAWMLSKH